VVVALDQPTIVPNVSGSRPVDKVAGSLVSWIGGGVQPANRSKAGMFDDAAPIWRFLEHLSAIENPPAARDAIAGLSSSRGLPCPRILDGPQAKQHIALHDGTTEPACCNAFIFCRRHTGGFVARHCAV
jgi:hypothetical protein